MKAMNKLFLFFKAAFVASIASSVLTSCGGSSSNDNSSSGPEANPENGNSNVRDESQLELVGQATIFSLVFAESLQQLGQAPVNMILQQLIANQASFKKTSDCETGEATIDLIDNDSNLRLSSGDEIEISYFGCQSKTLAGQIDGGLRVQLESLNVGSDDTLELSAHIHANDELRIELGEGEFLNVVGQWLSKYHLDASGATLTVESIDGSELLFNLPGAQERILNFEITRLSRTSHPATPVADGEHPIQLAFQIDYSSEMVNDEVSCQANKFEFGSHRSFNLVESDLRCSSSYGQSLLESDSTLYIRLNDEPRMLPSYNILVREVFEGFLGDEPDFEISQFVFQLVSGTLPYTVSDIIHDPIADNFIFAVSSQSPRHPNSLLAYNSETKSISLLKTLDFEPQQLDLASDGKRIYVSANSTPQISIFDTDNFSEIQRINLSSYQEITGFDVSPTDPDIIAAIVYYTEESTLGPIKDLIIISQGAVLPTTFRSNRYNGPRQGIDNTVFSQDGSAIWLGELKLEVNESGIGGQLEYYTGNSQLGIISNGVLYRGTTVYDATTYQKLGSFRSGGSYAGELSFSIANGLAFLSNPNEFYVCDLNTYTCFAKYELEHRMRPTFQTAADSRQLLISRQDFISVYTISDFNKPDASCPVETIIENQKEYVRLQCDVGDMVYDAQRHKLYLAVNGSKKPPYTGSYIAVFDPENLRIEQKVTVQSRPKSIALSPDGQQLFLVSEDREQIDVYSPDNLSPMDPIYFPPQPRPDSARNQIDNINLEEVIPSNLEPGVVFARVKYGDMAVTRDGEFIKILNIIPNRLPNNKNAISPDDRFYLLDENINSTELFLTSEGVEVNSLKIDGLDSDKYVLIENDKLFVFDGQMVDWRQQTVNPFVNLTRYGNSGNYIFSATASSQDRLVYFATQRQRIEGLSPGLTIAAHTSTGGSYMKQFSYTLRVDNRDDGSKYKMLEIGEEQLANLHSYDLVIVPKRNLSAEDAVAQGANTAMKIKPISQIIKRIHGG